MKPFILIIENNSVNRELAGSLLETEGMDVRYASDAESGLTILTKIRPALILVALDLIKVNGLILTQVLKNDPDTKNLSILALVDLNSNSPDFFDRSLMVFDGYIPTPLDKESFSKTIKYFLKQQVTTKSKVKEIF